MWTSNFTASREVSEAQNLDVASLFGSAPKKSGGGRPAEDVKLSRLAAYLVAMGGAMLQAMQRANRN